MLLVVSIWIVLEYIYKNLYLHKSVYFYKNILDKSNIMILNNKKIKNIFKTIIFINKIKQIAIFLYLYFLVFEYIYIKRK